MSFNQLNISSKKSPKRVGRGIAAGQGKTAGRGTKGQKARTGFSARAGFEGGQTPLAQRFPKLRGFTSHRTPAEIIFTGDLDSLGTTITNESIAEAGLVSSAFVRVKIVVKGDVSKKHTVTLQGASVSAIAAIEKAGGTFKKTPQIGRPASKIKSTKDTSSDKA